MASLTTDTSLTQQATALAKEFGLRLMTPASVTIEELEQISIDQLERVKALREQKYGTPGDVATKHPNESYGEFYTRKGRGLTYDEATASTTTSTTASKQSLPKFTGETKTAYSTSPSTMILLQPELISDEYKELHGITKRTFTGGTKNLWLQIYSYLQPSHCTRIELKCLCRLFNDVEKMITFNPNCSPLKPIPRGGCTSFPHPKYATLASLIDSLNGSDTRWIILPSMLLIANGVYDEGGEILTINIPISIIGESREHCIVMGGLQMGGKTEDDVNVSDLTLRESKGTGVCGDDDASIHLDNVSVENSEYCGVAVNGTKRNSMKNCNVSHSKSSGLIVFNDGLMTIDGNGTTIIITVQMEKVMIMDWTPATPPLPSILHHL